MVLGCFPLKSKKKRVSASMKRMDPEESKPTALPEPPKIPSRTLQSAPPSFWTRVKPIQPNNGGTGEKGSRARVMSAPSSIHGVAERDFYHDEQEEQPRDPRISTKESSPQPLPLPSPKTGSSLKNWGSFKSFNGNSGRLSASSASGPLPLPPSGTVRSFSYDEVVSACCAFASERCVSEGLSSVMYMASFGDDVSTAGLKKVEATVVRLTATTQSIKEFTNEVSTLASLQHHNLCKLVGYHCRDGSETRMLVYERLAHGSLDRLLHGRSDGPPLDWNSRMKIALCAAQGLTFLHEEGPFQAMYNEFSTANIQVDKDFSAKISGYGCAGLVPETETTSNNPALANLSVETLERGVLTPKSNVWSYGIVLLEMLTGRKNMDGSYPKEERNLVKWSKAFLADDCRLSLIMDPQLKGRFPAKAARSIADIAQKCLQVEPSERPTMRNIVDQLKIIQDMKYSCRFPLREPAPVAARKHMGRSSSLNTIIWTPAATAPPRTSFSPSPPPRRPSVSPTRGRALVFPPVFPPRACSSLEVMSREEVRRSSSTSGRRTSLEGF